ncbi:MAG: NERD domain-containing protein [Clostridia bacterium]|nr:NERD domain-containing protein [Clostridia bacterium]
MSIKKLLNEIDLLTEEEIVSDTFREKILLKVPSLSASDVRRFSCSISKFKELTPDYTLKCILLYSIWDPNNVIDFARRKGVFRYKAWGLTNNTALYLLKKILTYSEQLNLPEKAIEFIKMKIQLSWMFDFYKKTEEKIIKFIQKYHKNRHRMKFGDVFIEECLFKELLAYIDIVFHNYPTYHDPKDKHKLSGYSPEEIAESVSYIIFLYDNIIGIKDNIVFKINPSQVNSKDINNLILLGCQICQLQEWEVCIDYFDYKVNKIDRKYLIYASDELFEKSIRLGFIRKSMQTAVFKQNFYLHNKDVKGIQDRIDYIYNNLGDDLIKTIGSGVIKRYRLELPEPIFEAFSNKTNELFIEEILDISLLANEMIIPYDELLEKQITSNCTLKDVVMFKRFFLIISLVIEKLLYKQKDKSMIISSLVPNFSREILFDFLANKYVNDKDKAAELIELFSYTKSNKLDLQYTPLFKCERGFSFPATLLAHSNLLRNCIAYSYLSNNKIVNKFDKENLVIECKNVFENSQLEYSVFTNKKIKYNNISGEIDVLVVSDTDIYIIECKSPLEPTSNFEIRATYDHLIKASKQLDFLLQSFNDTAFLNNYLKNLGINNNPRSIHTCIILGNRLFNGYTIKSHPIRYIRELDMILNKGYVNSNKGRWRLWENNKFTNDDLLEFLSSEYKFAKVSLDSLKKRYETMYFEGKELSFETYQFDQQNTIKEYDKCFVVENRNGETSIEETIIDI